MPRKKLLHRLAIFLLFIGALYTTVSVISNVTHTGKNMWENQKQVNLRDGNIVHAEASFTNLNSSEQSAHFVERVSYKKEQELKKEKPQTLLEVVESNDYPRHNVMATGYTSGIESTGKKEGHELYGVTFSGVEVRRDLYSTIAADLNVYPIGTIMYIPEYGYGVVADKGQAITGKKIDLYYQTVDDVFAEWGKKEVDVHIIEIGQGELTEEELSILNNNEDLQDFRKEILD